MYVIIIGKKNLKLLYTVIKIRERDFVTLLKQTKRYSIFLN